MILAIADAVGIGFATVGEEHLFSSFLSSPGTIRTMYVQKGADTSAIRTDLNIALALSIGFAILMGFILGSKWTAWVGSAFGLMMYAIYKQRAQL